MLIMEMIGMTLLLAAACVLVGNLTCGVLGLGSGLSLRIAAGFVTILALFQLTATPFMCLKGAFSALFAVFLVLFAVLLLLSVLYCLKHPVGFSGMSVFKNHTVFWVLAAVLICFQIFMCAHLQHTDDDDAFYITIAATALKNNVIFGFDPASGLLSTRFPFNYGLVGWELFLAFWSRLFAVPPAVLAHTVIQPFLIMLAYVSVYCVAGRIVKRAAAVPCFMLVISAINLFGAYSAYTQASFLLTRIWQGKAVLVAIIFPILISVCMELYHHAGGENTGRFIFAALVMLAGCGASVMGDYLMPLLYVSVMLPLAFCIPLKTAFRSFPPLLLSMLPCAAYTVANLSVNNLANRSETVPDSYAHILREFCGPHYIFGILFLLSLAYVLKAGKKLPAALLCGSTVFLLLTLLNPLSASFFLHKPAFSPVYWRLFWLLPIYPAICFAVSDLVAKMKPLGSVFVLAGMLALLFFSGKYMFSKELFSTPKNSYKLPQDVLDLADGILKDSGGKSVSVFSPEDISAKLRQYDVRIVLIWPRRMYAQQDFSASEYQRLSRFYDTLYSEKTVGEQEVLLNMKEFGLQYLVMPDTGRDDYGGALKLIEKTDGYRVYRYGM